MTSRRQYDEAQLRRKVKEELRRRLKGVRAALPEDVRMERSARAAKHALALDAVRNARTIASYVPIRGELDPAAVADVLRESGATIALPVIDMEAGELVLREDVGDREPGPFGIPEPPASAPRIEAVDLVLVPALAVDPRGHRIGWGKGFYDQLLPSLGGALKVAMVYDFQLVPEVPNRDGDVAIDILVTDSRTLYAEAGESS